MDENFMKRFFSKRRMILFAVVYILLALNVGLFADGAGSRASYTRGGWVGPRYVAMGKCGAVLADDVYSIYWNPAGLSELKSKKKRDIDDIISRAKTGQIDRITEKDLLNFSEPASEQNVVHVAVSGAMLDAERNAVFAGAAFGLFSGVMGVGAYSVMSFEIDSYNEQNQRQSDTSYVGSTGYLSYGISLGAASIGFSLKGLYEKIADYNYAGAGIDAGAQVFILPFIKVGLTVYDVGTGLVPTNGGEDLDKNYDFGTPSFRINMAVISDVGFTFALGVMKKLEQDDFYPSFGLQYDAADFLTLYAGIDDVNFSAGVSMNMWGIDVSYALTFDQIDNGVNNLVAVSMFF